MPRGLLLRSCHDELREIGVVSRDQGLLLPYLCGIGLDQRFFLQLIRDPIGGRTDRFDLPFARQLKAMGPVTPKRLEVERAVPVLKGMRFEDYALDLINQPFRSAGGRT